MTSRRTRVLAALVVGTLLAGPACSRGGGDDDGFRLTLDGTAEVGGRTLGEGEHSVDVGETVRIVEGDATLSMPGDREVLLRDGSTLAVADEPELLDGDAVVVAGDATSVVAGDVEIEVDEGAARLQRGVGTTVAMYGGDAEVASAGRALDGGLRALRQVTIATEGQLPREPSPLVYDEDDGFDREFLGDAMSLGRALDGLSRGFTAQLGPSRSLDATLLADVLPIEVDDALLREDRSPGETLVGAAIVVESGDDVGEGWDEVFGFREDGAEWGLVALDQQVERDPLLGTLDGAFDASPLLFGASSTDGGRPIGTTVTTAPGGTTPTTSPTTTPAPPPEDPEGPGPTVPPVTVPPITIPPLVPEDPPDDPEPEDPVDGVVDLVGDLLDGDPLDELLGLDET